MFDKKLQINHSQLLNKKKNKLIIIINKNRKAAVRFQIIS